jgi:hypothetical protein
MSVMLKGCDPGFNQKLILGPSTGQDFDFSFKQLPPFPTTRRASTCDFAAPEFFSMPSTLKFLKFVALS